MTDDERVSISVTEAVERLKVIDGFVHTFRSAPGFLIGADWPLDELRKAMEEYGVEEAGDMARAVHHNLVLIDKVGPLFLETKSDS